MKNSIMSKFIAILLLITFLLIATLSTIITLVANKSLSEQSRVFTQAIKDEQSNEEALLRKALRRKGDALIQLLAQSGSNLIIEYDFETLNQLAKNGSTDSEIAYVTFYRNSKEALTKKFEKPEGLQILKRDVVFENEKIGYVEVGLDDTAVRSNIDAVNYRIDAIVKDTTEAKEKSITFTIILTVIISIVGVILLSVASFALLFYIVIKPINRVINFADKMAEGDLSFSLEVEKKQNSNRNEIEQLLTAMNFMAESLKTKAQLADKISHGDISVDVSLASEKDILGKALQKMLDTLRTKVELANYIAEGNLSVKVNLASEADVLGKALQDMVSKLHA